MNENYWTRLYRNVTDTSHLFFAFYNGTNLEFYDFKKRLTYHCNYGNFCLGKHYPKTLSRYTMQWKLIVATVELCSKTQTNNWNTRSSKKNQSRLFSRSSQKVYPFTILVSLINKPQTFCGRLWGDSRSWIMNTAVVRIVDPSEGLNNVKILRKYTFTNFINALATFHEVNCEQWTVYFTSIDIERKVECISINFLFNFLSFQSVSENVAWIVPLTK